MDGHAQEEAPHQQVLESKYEVTDILQLQKIEMTIIQAVMMVVVQVEL